MNDSRVYWSREAFGREGLIWTILATEQGVCRLMYPQDTLESAAAWLERFRPGTTLEENDEWIDGMGVVEKLKGYFLGEQVDFSGVPLDLFGTPFQKEVWSALLMIPYGEVQTYRDIAAAIGRPKAVRAVGTANGANPVPVIVPCHRVIGSNQTLVGYRGGLKIKDMLLRLEGVKPVEMSGHARFQF
ncbi:methylated-DNA--[protein]-cysteine S-methyltransferase [Paenibacillus antibioticophila]|uniref:methylated-DNA--[protein]-cysteine S-methyltransferase n=1 Tax=Paenibacillus antibioticophila TaxID=1274374 RepID=UPI0005CA1A87|nr:methylated-DNA--[protein]-cysteine S-methyltransferase [Paenibacillus antibioticophila]